jgi:hypothetical protein
VEREIEEQHYRERRPSSPETAEIREKYKTVWEGMVSLIDMAADRGVHLQPEFELGWKTPTTTT